MYGRCVESKVRKAADASLGGIALRLLVETISFLCRSYLATWASSKSAIKSDDWPDFMQLQ